MHYLTVDLYQVRKMLQKITPKYVHIYKRREEDF